MVYLYALSRRSVLLMQTRSIVSIAGQLWWCFKKRSATLEAEPAEEELAVKSAAIYMGYLYTWYILLEMNLWTLPENDKTLRQLVVFLVSR